MDLIDEKWEPGFTLLGIFEGMLHLLLEDPNPANPMNNQARDTFNNNPADFK